MKIQWLDYAVQDLRSLRNYIKRDNPTVAKEVSIRILKTVNRLVDHPGMGRMGRVPNTRELVIADLPYIIPYKVKNNVIEILRVLHGAMEWPDKF